MGLIKYLFVLFLAGCSINPINVSNKPSSYSKSAWANCMNRKIQDYRRDTTMNERIPTQVMVSEFKEECRRETK